MCFIKILMLQLISTPFIIVFILYGVIIMPNINAYISKDTQNMLHQEIEKHITKWSRTYKVEEELIKAIIDTESQWYPFAIRYEPHLERAKWYLKTLSVSNETNRLSFCSMGLMQILYGVAKHDLGFRGQPTTLMSPSNSIKYGTKQLKNLQRRFPNIKDAISSYNQGSPRKDKDGKYRNAMYVFKVYRAYRKFGGEY